MATETAPMTPTPPPTTPPTTPPQPETLSSYIRTTTQSYISRAAHILGPDRVQAKGKSVIRSHVRIHGDYGAVVRIGRYCLLDEGVVIAPTVVDLEVTFDDDEEEGEEETTKKAKKTKENFPMLALQPTGFSNHHRRNRDAILKQMRDRLLANLSPPNSNADSNTTSNDQPKTTPQQQQQQQKALPLSIGSHTHIHRNTVVRSLSIGCNVLIGSDCLLHPRSVIKDCCVVEDGTVIPPGMVVPPFSRVRGVPGRVVGSLPECWGGEMAERCVEDFFGFVTGLSEGGK